MTRDRSLYFGHTDAAAAPAGLCLSATGGLAMAEDHEAIRQDILLLLLTRPGERVMRPRYGCDVHRLVFWPNDDTTAGLVIHYVRRAIEDWEPRVDAVEVDAVRRRDDASRLDIHIRYRVRRSDRRDGWHLDLDLGDGALREGALP